MLQLAHLRWVIERPVCEVLWQSRPLAHRARGGRTSSTGSSREVGAISRALIAAISSRVSVDMGVGLGTYGAAARATATLDTLGTTLGTNGWIRRAFISAMPVASR